MSDGITTISYHVWVAGETYSHFGITKVSTEHLGGIGDMLKEMLPPGSWWKVYTWDGAVVSTQSPRHDQTKARSSYPDGLSWEMKE